MAPTNLTVQKEVPSGVVLAVPVAQVKDDEPLLLSDEESDFAWAYDLEEEPS